MAAYNTLTFTYNANGDLVTRTNTTTSTTTTYSYDVFGNLVRVTLPTGTVITYEIDGLNRRIGKKVNGVLQKRWVYMDQTRIAAELSAAGAITKRFIYGSKANIPDYMLVGTAKYRIISDHLGSPRLIVRQSDGVVVQRTNHDEFGRVTEDTSPGYLPFGFAGGLYDNQTGLVRFGARDYDAETGRWTSKDPILFRGGDTNLFGYVENDPVNWVDAGGLTKDKPGQVVNNDGLSGGGGPATIPAGSTVYVAPNGQAAVAPRGSTVGPTSNGAGLRIIPPGSQAGGSTVRLMDPTSQYPNGYGRIQNPSGNYTDRFGNPVGKKDPSGHICP
jgi:RHS repeat-associated protein